MLVADTVERSEAEIMELTRARDPEAFAALVDRYKNLLVNYLTRLTGCRDRAEEYAQETFVRFYQKLDRYREQGQLSAYLLRIATNLVRSEERRRQRWRLLQPVLSASGFVAHGLDDPASENGPQAKALAHEEHRQVTRAIAALDLLYRAPLVLREIEGLSYREIAEALDCNEGTVKSRLHRGRNLLKEKLAPYWDGGH